MLSWTWVGFGTCCVMAVTGVAWILTVFVLTGVLGVTWVMARIWVALVLTLLVVGVTWVLSRTGGGTLTLL